MLITTTDFASVARGLAKMHGVADLVIATIPHPFSWTGLSREQVKERATGVLAQVIAGLTSGGFHEGIQRRREEQDSSSRGRIRTGDSLEEINDYFYAMKMTDGLAIVPPTPERVQAMVEASGRDPLDVIGAVPPKNGLGTVEKLAVNAVMAGCLPSYFPVIIAAMEALLEEDFNLYGIQATTNPVTPLLIVNGPIARELGINSSYNCLGQGVRANATIGRAIRLILLNIGGGIREEIDQATQGQPAKYSFCLAENEERSPWPPLHVDRGFEANSSAVTVFGAGGTTNIRPYASGARGVMASIARMMALGGCPRHSYGVVIINPQHANLMASEGYSKEDVRRYLFENARVRPSGFTDEVAEMMLEEPVLFKEVKTTVGKIEHDTLIPCSNRPEDIFILVAGGAGGHCVFIPATFSQLTYVVTKAVS